MLSLVIASLGGIVLYPNFAEVRQELELPAGEWIWQPEPGILGSIFPGSLYLSGVTETSRLIQSGTLDLRVYQGQEVLIELEDEFVSARLVNAEQRIFRLASGEYLMNYDATILFPSPVGLRPDQVIFRYQGQGTGELSYLSGAFQFEIFYTLDAQSGQLVAWSAIQNQTGQEFTFSEAEYISGEVPVSNGVPVRPQAMYAEASISEPKFAGSSGGVYRYTHPGELVLPPGKSEFPFLRSQVKPIYTWKYQGGFDPSERELFLDRSYRFDAPGPLAGGVVSVRDQGRFVGQARADTTAPGEEVEVSLGSDPLGRAKRQVEVLVNTPTEQRYRVTTSFENSRSEPVSLVLEEEFYADSVEIDFPEAAQTGRSYRLDTELPASSKREFTYTATLRFEIRD